MIALILLVAAFVLFVIGIFKHAHQVSCISAGLACASAALWIVPHLSK